MKKFCIIFFCLIFISYPAFAFKGVKFLAESCFDFNPDNFESQEMTFKTTSEIQFDSNLIIPENAIITADFVSSKKERRFHKSGFFTCRPIKYTVDGKDTLITQDLKMIGKRYDKVDGKEAALTGTELATTTAAAFIIPGVDIVYYFTKGAIQNKKAETRFKSGVHNAYDNSILWVFLKGKPITFKQGEQLNIFMSENDKKVSDKQLEKLCN